MLIQRVVTAIICLIIFSISLFEVSANYSSLFIALLCLGCIYEVAKMYKFSIFSGVVLGLLFLIASAFIYMAFFTNLAANIHKDYPILFNPAHLIGFNQIILLISVLFWVGLVPCLLFNKPFLLSKLVVFIICGCLFIIPLYSFILIHSVYGSLQLVSVIAVAWVADSGAYFVGRSFGKHKLAPQISPAKSIEGAIGGIIFVYIYFSLLKYFHVVTYLDTSTKLVIYSCVLSIFSIVGDLFESWLKRGAKVKDSGSILPGHGGLFDRLDSVVAVLTIFAVLIQIY